MGKGRKSLTAAPAPPTAKKARIYDFFAPQGDAAESSSERSNHQGNEGSSAAVSGTNGSFVAPTSRSPPPPPPSWGALIKPKASRAWTVRQQSCQPFFPLLAFTITFKPVLQDSYFRAPGMGRSSNGFWGGIRSALTAAVSREHPNSNSDDDGGGKGEPIDEAATEGGEAPLPEENGDDDSGGGEGEEAEEEGNGDSSSSGNSVGEGEGKKRSGSTAGTTHKRNFDLIIAWLVHSDLLSPQDQATLSTLTGLSIKSQGLFWKVYHSFRGCYRFEARWLGKDPEVKWAMEELLSSGLILDMADVTKADYTEWIGDLDDLLSSLHADELKHLALGMVGKAAVASLKGGTREDLLVAIEGVLYGTGSCTGGQLVGQRVRLRNMATCLRATLAKIGSSGSSSSASSSRIVKVKPTIRKLVHRCIALFFLSSGYEAEDAVVLMKSDLSKRSFALPRTMHITDNDTKHGNGGENNKEEEEAASSAPKDDDKQQSGPNFFIDRAHLPLFDHLVGLIDVIDIAATVGDADLAYGCLHSASNLLLRREITAITTTDHHHHCLSTIFHLTGPNSPSLDSHLPSHIGSLHDLPVPLSNLLTRCVMKGIHLLQRDGKYNESKHYLRMLLDATKEMKSSVRGRYWTRLVLSLTHKKCFVEALRVCDEALDDTCVDGEDRLYLQSKHVPLCKQAMRWSLRKFPPALSADVLTLHLALQRDSSDGGGKGVEDRTLDYLLGEEEGWKGLHCENSCFLTLFGLLFWEVIFAHLPGVFTTPYQSAPHDLHSRRFTERRKDLVAGVLRRIERGDAGLMVEHAYRHHWGKSCVGVDWSTWAMEDMRVIANALGPKAVHSICTTLSSDYALWRHGLPDLLLWKPPKIYGEEGAVRCVEVKGPGDDLSWAQKAWIDRLLASGVNVQVARIKDTSGRASSGSDAKGWQQQEGEDDEGELFEEGY